MGGTETRKKKEERTHRLCLADFGKDFGTAKNISAFSYTTEVVIPWFARYADMLVVLNVRHLFKKTTRDSIEARGKRGTPVHSSPVPQLAPFESLCLPFLFHFHFLLHDN